MEEDTNTRAARAGRNQSLYREVNERVKELNDAFDALPIGEWICECANEECFEFEFEDVPVIINAFRRMVRWLDFDVSEMAITTYICARAHGKRFVMVSGHQDADSRLVQQGPRFTVVENARLRSMPSTPRKTPSTTSSWEIWL